MVCIYLQALSMVFSVFISCQCFDGQWVNKTVRGETEGWVNKNRGEMAG